MIYFQHANVKLNARFSPNGNRGITTTDRELALWDMALTSEAVRDLSIRPLPRTFPLQAENLV
jgi:hypothetical protein